MKGIKGKYLTLTKGQPREERRRRSRRQLSGVLISAAVFGGVHARGQAVETRDENHAAQLPTAPSAVQRPLMLPGGVRVERERSGAIPLTLDDAIQIALKNNVEIVVRKQQERYVRGQTLTVGNALLPNIEARGYTQAQEIDLAAMGFKPGAVKVPGVVGEFPTIVKVNTTSAQLTLSQQLFNVPAFYLYFAARKAGEAANWATLSARGSVVLATGGLYLKILADEADVGNAEGLVKQDELVYEHAKASRDAGVGINLDVLRAQVQLQNEQQILVRAVNTEAKDKILLNREMGQPAGQELKLLDAVPFADLGTMTVGEAMEVAEVKRKDLRGLEVQLEVAEKARQAVRFERLPTLGVGGYYGVLGETRGLYHGVFAAEGLLSIPVFQEATFRGQREVAAAQVAGLRRQIEGRRGQIEAEIRSSMLDVQTAAELVKVARSSVGLATEALNDATMRFTAGVEDNMPVVRAQTTLTGAQAQMVQAEFQYNYAKLTLARNTGVVETQYRQYLGR